MIKTKELIKFLDHTLNLELAYEWDNCGHIIDNSKDYTKKILLCLEVSTSSINEAIEKRVDVILAHHPLIFSPIKTISDNDIYQHYAMRLIKNNIDLYVSHTNFDKLNGGLNDYAAKLLGLREVDYLIKEGDDKYMGRIGCLKEKVTFTHLLDLIKSAFKAEDLRYISRKDTTVQKIGIVTGSGADFIEKAFNAGCDAFITGDMKYHDSREAYFYGRNIVDLGHYNSEIIFPNAMEEKLISSGLNNIEIIKSYSLKNPITQGSLRGDVN